MNHKIIKSSCWAEIHCGLEIRDTKFRYSYYVTIEVVELLPQSNNVLIGQRFQKEYEVSPFSIGDIAVINLSNWDPA